MTLPRLLFAILSVLALALLLRDVAAIPLQVPLDPNEGWNAYNALAAMAGHLYPPPGAWLFNNYPPLSFYPVGALGALLGDAIIAGRILSLLAFAAVTGLVFAILCRMGCARFAAAFGALLFAAGLLVGSDYVAMDDPQLLGHALQVAGLLLLTRKKPVAAAALMAAGLFVKHNLVALPLASGLWLLWEDRRAALRFILAVLGLGLLGLMLFRIAYGENLWRALASARRYGLENLIAVAWRFLPWPAAAFEFAAWLAFRFPRDKWVRFSCLYLLVALAVGLALTPGDGVDVNIFFDAVIALGFTGGLIQSRFKTYGRAAAAMAAVVPLLLYAAAHFRDDNFSYTQTFRRQAPGDIALLAKGPAACEMPGLCYWAGRRQELDVFNSGEAIRGGARSPAPLVALLKARHFAALQFDSLDDFSLGSAARAALMANYHVARQDDNGVFLVPGR